MRFSAGPPGSPGALIPETSPLTSAAKTATPASESCSAIVWRVIVLPVPVAPATRPCRFIIRSGTRTTASVSSFPSWTPRPRSIAAPSVAYASPIVAAKSLIGRGIVSPGSQPSNTSSGSAAETSAFGASTSSDTRSSAATLISTYASWRPSPRVAVSQPSSSSSARRVARLRSRSPCAAVVVERNARRGEHRALGARRRLVGRIGGAPAARAAERDPEGRAAAGLDRRDADLAVALGEVQVARPRGALPARARAATGARPGRGRGCRCCRRSRAGDRCAARPRPRAARHGRGRGDARGRRARPAAARA